MPGEDLKFKDNTFDFVFSFSSIEHFGGHEAAAKTMREIERVIKPNGIACISTEFIINKSDHYEYFTIDNLYKYIIESHGLELVGKKIDFRLSERTQSHIIDINSRNNSKVDIIYFSEGVLFIPIIFLSSIRFVRCSRRLIISSGMTKKEQYN